MLEICNLSAAYPGKKVLFDLSMTVPAGQVTVLLGPNGCGKSTLLKVLCGILPPAGGQVLWQGQNLLTLPQRQRATKIAYLAQGRQVPDITAGRLVLHGRFPYLSYPRRYGPADLAAADEAMNQLGISDLADRPLAQLSGGQRQKVYIAMALAQDTPVLLLDEPTTYLDISHQLQLLHQAHALSRSGKTVLMVVHDIPAAMTAADRIILMEQGRAVFQGTPEELYASRQMDRVFGIKLERVDTPAGVRYFCESK